MGGGGVLYLIYIVYPNPVRLIQCYLGWGGRIITSPTTRPSFNTLPTPSPLRYYITPPNPRNTFTIYHSITFSYTILHCL